jgi:hypothetical protein
MSRHSLHIFLLMLLFFCVSGSSAFARFDEQNRSINGTAETLPSGGIEVGVSSLSLGVSDHIMLSIPSFPLLTGKLNARADVRLQLGNLRVTPHVGANFIRVDDVDAVAPAAGFGIGFSGGDRRQHSFAVIMSSDYGPTLDVSLSERGFPPRLRVESREDGAYRINTTLQVEYDYYTNSGNLFYIGSMDRLPYWGFTWAFETIHFGFLGIPATAMLPIVPYLYLRF